MWKYKKAIISASWVMVLHLMFAMLIKDRAIYFSSLYVHIINDYSYIFFFIMILFVNLFELVEDEMIVYKFGSVEKYIKFKLIEKSEFFSIFFISLILFQTILFSIIDPNIEIFTIMYSNMMFFLLVNLTYLLIIIGKTNKKLTRLACLFLFWAVSYFMYIIHPTSLYNIINIFSLVYKLNVSELFRYLFIILSLLIFCILRISNKRRYIALWLE